MKENKKNYFKSIATLMSGSMLAQVFTLICSPILTRICSAETLGIYSLVTGAITIFGMVMSFRYELCIVSESEEKNIYPLIKLSFFLCTCFSIAITFGYLIYFYFADVGENFIIMAAITGLLAFLMGVINILTAYNNRQRDYSLITKTYVARIFCQNIFNLIAGFAGLGAIGLSFSQFIGYMAGVNGQARPVLKHRNELKSVTVADMRAAAARNKKQAIFSMPAALANGLSYSLINYFIEALFTTATVGYYSISYRILGLPLTIISANVSRVFFEKASFEYAEKGNFKSIYKYTVLLLTAMGVPMGILMIWLAPWACEIFFGKGWSIAGVYIRLLTPMFVLRFIAGGVNCAAIIVKKQQYDLIIQILLTVCVVAVFIAAPFAKMDIETFLAAVNAGFSILYLIYIGLFWKCSLGTGDNIKDGQT